MTDDEGPTNGKEPTDQEQSLYAPRESDRAHTSVEWGGVAVQPVVLPLALLSIAVVVTVTLGLGDQAASVYELVFATVNRNFGWFYVLAVDVFVVALVAFGVSRFGAVRLGGADADPEFSRFSWLAMLFTAGMGIGLLFFGVAEPMFHFRSGGGSFFGASPQSPAAGRAATALTMFHWGVHPWAIYGVTGLALAFFSYNRGLPLSFRSAFYPLLGDRIFGWPGHVVDLAAVVATIFGLATMTGLGALQINAGLSALATSAFGTGIPTNAWMQIGIIATVIGATTVSILAGLENGIRRLSKVNVVLMCLLLLFVLVAGPTAYLLDVFTSGLGAYLGNFLELSLYAEAFAGSDAGWQHDWTIFFWGFWITWAPFVGLFVARISRGRTVREFVTGILLVPVAFSLVWMATFSGASLFVELHVASGGIVGPLTEQGRAVALFEMLSHYPFALFTSLVATANLLIFFVTSADSGALAMSFLLSGGQREPGRLQRALWPSVVGMTAGVLLLGNGLDALQTAVITTGLPFAVIILLLVHATYLGLRREVARDE